VGRLTTNRLKRMRIWGWKIPWGIGKPKRTPKLTSLPYEVLTKVMGKLSADDIHSLVLSQSDDILSFAKRYHRSRLFRLRFCQKAKALGNDGNAAQKFFAAHGRLI